MADHKVVLSTRSMSIDLTEKSQSLFDSCKCITDKQSLFGLKDWEYLYECFFNTDTDYLISADEDFFLLQPWIIDEIIKYMEKHDIEIIGAPCSSVYSEIIDSWFLISNIRKLKNFKLSRTDIVDLRVNNISDFFNIKTKSAHNLYDKHEFFFLLMKQKGCKIKLFERKVVEFEVLLAKGHEFGIHTRHGRDYHKREIKQHIDEIYNFVRRKYHEKHFSNS